MIDILFSIAGIVILIKGKVNVSSTRAVSGLKARLLGVLYILCFPIGYLLRMFLVNFKEYDYIWLGFVYPALLIIVTIVLVLSIFSKGSDCSGPATLGR